MENNYIEKIQIHRKNRIAGLYPSAKGFIVLAYSISTFILGTFHLTDMRLDLLLIPWFFVIPVLCIISGVLAKSMKAMKAVATVSAIIFAAQLFLIPGGKVLWSFGFLKIYVYGLRSAIRLSFLVLDVAGIFVWLFQTTSNKELSRAMEDSGMNYKAAYVFMSSLQMIDILGKNSKSIMNAQRARGVETEGNLIIRAKAFFPSLVPLILGAIIGSEERVLTLEARGFSMQCQKTHLFKLDHSGLEKPAVILSTLITSALLAGRVIWGIMR